MKYRNVLLLYTFYFLLFACSNKKVNQTEKKTTNLSTDHSSSLQPISFSQDVMPIVQRKCIMCHSTANPYQQKPALKTYRDLATNLAPFEQAIISKIMPPANKEPLTESELGILIKWISEGASNN